MLYKYIQKLYSFICLVICKRKTILNPVGLYTVVLPNLIEKCVICHDVLYITNNCTYRVCYTCNHMFHYDCYSKWMQPCPICRNKNTNWFHTLIHSNFIYYIGYSLFYCKKIQYK